MNSFNLTKLFFIRTVLSLRQLFKENSKKKAPGCLIR